VISTIFVQKTNNVTHFVWITYANFKTKAERDREFKVMLQKDWVIED
jgi:hypothetical protein